MTTIHRRLTHELSQKHIEMASAALTSHMEREKVDTVTQTMVGSMLLALKDKNELVTALYEEIDTMKEMAK